MRDEERGLILTEIQRMCDECRIKSICEKQDGMVGQCMAERDDYELPLDYYQAKVTIARRF